MLGVAMSFEFVTVHAHGPHVLEVRMDRPEKRNAMNPKMWKEMGACFAAIADEPACRAVAAHKGSSISTP